MKGKTLVLGASNNPSRYSYLAVNRLSNNGYPVIPIGVRQGSIGDLEIITTLPELENVDTVTLYLNPMRQEAYYDYILKLTPRRVIFNPGTENAVFAGMLKREGIEVEIACTLVMLAANTY